MVEMVKRKRLSDERYLGKPESIESSVDSLNQRLGEIVGAGGKLTPLVKSVTIHCSRGIPDLDIVDTPGINDPIASRSRQAQKLLSGCDAVLMLSYGGQFMDSTDADFFLRNVPKEGIGEKVLICSKFDSALLDAAKNYDGNLDKASVETKRDLIEHALDVIEGVEKEGDGIESKDILFVSALCATLATKPAGSWSKEERDLFHILRDAYPDWLDSPIDGAINDATKTNLEREFGNRKAIDGCLEEIRQSKERIIADKMRAFLPEKRATAIEEVGDLIKDTESRRRDLQEANLEQVNRQIDAVKAVMENIKMAVLDAWDILVEKQSEGIVRLRDDARKEFRSARGVIDEGVESRTKTKRVEKSAFGRLGKFLRGIFRRDQYETHTYEEKHLNVVEIRNAIDNIEYTLNEKIGDLYDTMFNRDFVRTAFESMKKIMADQLENDISAMIKMEQMKRAIRQAIEKIAGQARAALKKREKIDHSDFFGSLAKYANDPEAGQEMARSVLKSMKKQADDLIEQVKSIPDQAIKQAKEKLLPATTQELTAYLKKMESDLASKEFAVQRYGLSIEGLQRFKDTMEEVASGGES